MKTTTPPVNTHCKKYKLEKRNLESLSFQLLIFFLILSLHIILQSRLSISKTTSNLPLFSAILTFGCAKFAYQIFLTLTARMDFKFELLTFLLITGSLIFTSLHQFAIPLSLFLLFVGFSLYFNQRPLGFFLLGISALWYNELFVYLLLCIMDNVHLRRIELKKMVTEVTAFLICAILLGVLKIPLAFTQSPLNSTLSVKSLMGFLANALLGPYILAHFPFAVMAFFSLLTILFIFFALQHLHPPDFVIRDQRNNIIGAGAFVILLLHAISTPNTRYLLTPLFMVPLVLAVYIAATNKLDRVLNCIFALLALPIIFNFYKVIWSGVFSSNHIKEFSNSAEVGSGKH